MKNPRINRIIGYIILFIGFILFYKGFRQYGLDGSFNGKSITLIICASLFVVCSTIWMIGKVRCPHCGKLLDLKLYDISTCKFCGKDTTPSDEK